MGREGGIQGRGKVSSLQNNAGELGENAGVCVKAKGGLL